MRFVEYNVIEHNDFDVLVKVRLSEFSNPEQDALVTICTEINNNDLTRFIVRDLNPSNYCSQTNITISKAKLDQYSQEKRKAIIAHEFGHIASLL